MRDKEEDHKALLVQLAEGIYGRHTHAGRAYVSFEHALHCAAVLVGVAQSAEVMQIIEQAKTNPAEAFEKLNLRQANFARQVDEGRKRQMSELAEALRAGEVH